MKEARQAGRESTGQCRRSFSHQDEKPADNAPGKKPRYPLSIARDGASVDQVITTLPDYLRVDAVDLPKQCTAYGIAVYEERRVSRYNVELETGCCANT
jgi:hypothetical protein